MIKRNLFQCQNLFDFCVKKLVDILTFCEWHLLVFLSLATILINKETLNSLHSDKKYMKKKWRKLKTAAMSVERKQQEWNDIPEKWLQLFMTRCTQGFNLCLEQQWNMKNNNNNGNDRKWLFMHILAISSSSSSYMRNFWDDEKMTLVLCCAAIHYFFYIVQRSVLSLKAKEMRFLSSFVTFSLSKVLTFRFVTFHCWELFSTGDGGKRKS